MSASDLNQNISPVKRNVKMLTMFHGGGVFLKPGITSGNPLFEVGSYAR